MRYRVETWDARGRQCLTVWRGAWRWFLRANADDPDLCRAVARLNPDSPALVLGGGASPLTRITRER